MDYDINETNLLFQNRKWCGCNRCYADDLYYMMPDAIFDNCYDSTVNYKEIVERMIKNNQKMMEKWGLLNRNDGNTEIKYNCTNVSQGFFN